MANPNGKNGYHNGNQPNDDELWEELLKLSTEMLTQDQARARLKAKFNYSIGRSKYFTLMSKFNIPTPRQNAKTMPPELMKSLVLEKLNGDVSQRNGPNIIQNKLARDSVPLPHNLIRSTQKEVQGPAAAIQCMPGYGKPKIPRGQLLVIGPFQEIHTDGHEKYARQALRMGSCTIGIYGMHDHVGFIHLMRTVPDACEGAADTIRFDHHLDISWAAVQMTYDLGHETKEMKRQQFVIHERCSSLDSNEFPVVWETKSTHNISIESAWKWFRQHNGIGIHNIIEQGKSNGLFIQSNPIHTNLFHWLFPKLVQSCLDDFIAYWNTHKIRKQKDARLPSGVTPRHAMECPEQYGMVSGAIDVPPELVKELRSKLPAHDDVFRCSVANGSLGSAPAQLRSRADYCRSRAVDVIQLRSRSAQSDQVVA
ncbi:hypothetical protein PQX77_021144 [Marasmius sp. AFHP31]|nr:hypothetical protein PQX77_021144 [Marasmius sp. AFHP31]